MLSSLRLVDIARRRRVACRRLSRLSTGPHGVSVEQVLARELSELGVPVVSGLLRA